MTDDTQRQDHKDTERARREVVQLLRSILEEVTITAQGRPRALSPEADRVIELFDLLGARIELLPGTIIT